MSDPRSRIPSVDAVVAAAAPLVEAYGRVRTVEAVRAAVDDVRYELGAPASGAGQEALVARVADPDLYLERARRRLEADEVPSLRRVVNATGVVLHTNLGRAPLAPGAVEAMRAAAGYANLEFDLEAGVRGSRYVHSVELLRELTGAEDALVVNNAAGGLVLAVSTVAMGRGIAVSRGELVEIGGGFRIPEVLERAGARLVEVGSTNRTRVADYERALEGGAVDALLKVHRSNFRITGFTEDASIPELAALARSRDVALIHDLGSGLMLDASFVGLPDEPTAAASIASGADAVVVSGDKLLGGPQAGVIVGKASLVERMRRNPLCRALRVDKVTLAGLEATLRLYRDPERARREIPTLSMLARSPIELRSEAEALGTRLAEGGVTCDVVETAGAVGGGTYPGVELPSWAVRLWVSSGLDDLARRLRDGRPPVVGRVVDDALLLDVRTVLPADRDDLVRRVVEAWSAG